MGVIALEDIEAGQLIAEYVGEVINQNELARRMSNEYRDMRHTYIMTYIKGLLLDATAKGGLARYLNHSCGPNCETQYWMVKGETRVGIFARQAIAAGTELCYDYNLQWNGFARVRAAQRAHESMRDSDDDAAEGAIYIDEGAEGATKVQQLGAGPTLPTAWAPRRRPRLGEMAAPMEAERVGAIFEELLEAPPKYASPYDAMERASGSDVPMAIQCGWDGQREAVEERWREQQRVLRQLLLGLQSIGYSAGRSKGREG